MKTKYLIIYTVLMSFGILGVIINLYKMSLGIDSFFYLFNEVLILIGIVLLTYGFKKLDTDSSQQKFTEVMEN